MIKCAGQNGDDSATAAALPNRERIGMLFVVGPASEKKSSKEMLTARLPLATKACRCMIFGGRR
jgi:hypothetical protein